jgi:hypothetical protein
MINVKIVTLSYGIDEAAFDCPYCKKEHTFYKVSPVICDKCGHPLPDVGNLFNDISFVRLKNLIVFHKQERDNPTLGERIEYLGT